METIDDIVRELRNEPLAEGGAKPWLHYLADRIEEAYRNQLADGTMCTMSCRESGHLLEQYVEREKAIVQKNARLKSVLVPILQCDPEKCSPMSAVFAIARAHQIYNEEAR